MVVRCLSHPSADTASGSSPHAAKRAHCRIRGHAMVTAFGATRSSWHRVINFDGGDAYAVKQVAQVMLGAIKERSATKLREHFALRGNAKAWEGLWLDISRAAYAGKLLLRDKPDFEKLRKLYTLGEEDQSSEQ
ncbi:hypothetical protein AAL_00322 [Moelleriella libera RCEF 2490]|uniref:Uncharacterized protein n=1 Tax=Moelleriella libera RCEF 2490 TaxID=1081109 RepID=A0A166UR35_9HYPO|nr:hypothetical protein AAL_00322 [Moelleriella libera RCEF 2490]